jgi:hypothetical protein
MQMHEIAHFLSKLELTDLNTEGSKYDSLKDKTGYPGNYRGLINDQRRFHVRQAAYLTKRVPELVSPYEYLVIGGSFSDVEDIETAEQFYQRASRSPSRQHERESPDETFDQVIALRGYARFLFLQARLEEGRQKFHEALLLLPKTSETTLHQRGDTYERWARTECDFGEATQYVPLLRSAISEYESLKLQRRRQQEIARVAGEISTIESLSALKGNGI